MNEIYKALDEKDGAIEALKISNRERQIIIDDLIAEGVKKDDEIASLRRRIKIQYNMILTNKDDEIASLHRRLDELEIIAREQEA